MVAIRAERPKNTYTPGLTPPPRPILESDRAPRAPSRPAAMPCAVSRRVVPLGRNEQRQARRKPVALRAWLMSLEGAARGYALDVSETGARLGGVCSPLRIGERALCKLQLRPGEEALVVRAEVVRNDGCDCAVRFVDVNLDEWFRLARFVDERPGPA